jgi:hypothetical protein
MSVAGVNDNKLYKVGSGENPLTTPNDFPYDITYSNHRLYEIDAVTGTIYKIIPTNGSVESSFSAPAVGSEKYFGLTSDGTDFYVGTYGRYDKIYKINTSGSVITSFDAPGNEPMGLAYDGAYLWLVDDENDTCYKLEK